MTTQSYAQWRRAALGVIVLQASALAVYWYVGSGPVRTDFDRAVDDGGLYVAVPLFAILVALGVVVVFPCANRGALRYLAIVVTGATLVTLTFAALLDALIFLVPTID